VRKIVGLAIALLLTAGVGQAAALPFELTFTAPIPGFPGSPVSGSFQYEAASLTSPIDSLTAVNLTLDGHVYTLANTGFVNSAPLSFLGGLVNGVVSMGANTNDFLLRFNHTTGQPIGFDAATIGAPSIVFATGFTVFSIAPAQTAAVPEPTTVVLVALGLAGLGVRRLRKRR
jgi:hypothetical protein